MRIRARLQLMFVTAAILAATGLAGARQQPALTPAQAAALTAPMPLDPAITMGKLDNGMRYYVRANKKPEKRAELRLVVRAGSILEDDTQQGLAHFVEHMAFNGTTHFPKQEVVHFIESLGMRFGADVNAGTGFDETTYMLTVPTDKPEDLDRAFLVMEDWAHNVSFEASEVDRERGVVIEEWRLHRGAGGRMTDKMFPVLLKGSRYADRIPIGKTEILQSAKADQLKKFYTDWYRPDLMAVVAVGDFDKAAIETEIKTHFASIPAAKSPKPRPDYGMPDHAGTVYSITTDKENPSASVEVDNLLPARTEGSIGYYRQKMVDGLFSGMLNARFSEMAQKPDAPFVFAGGGRGAFLVRSKDDASLFAQVKEDGIERGLDAILGEAERVARFGFTATELERQKTNVLRGRERAAVEADNTVSASRAAEYIRNFLQGESLPTLADEYALAQRFLPQITIDEVNKLAKEWYPENNRLVIASAPEKAGLVVPDEAKLAAVMKAVPAKALTAYVDTVGAAALLDSMPSPGAVVKTTTNAGAGLTEWDLSNGVKVVLKPTTFKADEILFQATSPGGTSLASDADYIPADTATQVVTAGGVGKFNAIDLRKVLTGKVASAGPSISEISEGMGGSASKKDLETMFQLIYLRFTAPRADPGAVSAQASQMKAILANITADPGFAFEEALNSVMTQDHPRRRVPTAAQVDQWNLDKSMAFYKDRFSDASDFTFVFVGSFDEATIKPLVEKYLGGLPATHRKETWKDEGVRMPTGVIEKQVQKGIDPKSQAAIVFSGPFDWNQTQRVALRAMSEILQTRLLETIREELGGTYSISARQDYSKIPNPEYSVTIGFGCDPARLDALVKRVLEEVDKLKTTGPTEKQVTDEREALLREFEANSKLNGYLINQILLKYQYGEDPASLWLVPDYYKKIDAAMIQQAAKTYLNPANRVTVTLVPEKK